MFLSCKEIVEGSFRDEDWTSDLAGRVFEMGRKDRAIPSKLEREIPTIQET